MIQKNIITQSFMKSLIEDFISESPLNTMKNKTGDPAWDEVEVGFASGADPIFQQYKEYVGPFHWTPWEVYHQNCSRDPANAGELTVISWVLPQRSDVKKSNRKSGTYPSEEWARIRIFGEEFNAALRRHVVSFLKENGHSAVAPMLAPGWTIVKSQQFSYASSWSERHAAHAAGLGTFGLCDGLITRKGKAMRTGSVVAKISLPPTERLYSTHQAWCLFYAEGTCGKCIDRCPARAITQAGHDKEKCRQHLLRAREYVKETYHFEGYGCGLCQVAVPCESGIPVKAARDAMKKGIKPPLPPPLA